MGSRRIVLAAGLLIAAGVLVAGVLHLYVSGAGEGPGSADPGALVRPESPVIGRADAPVTIVEFFDPSCEGCRAFYPIVKRIMAEYPGEVRLVLRYVLFHRGSEEAARMLEAARRQDVFVPVLEAILEAQPAWHDDPELEAAWQAAAEAGLDVEQARRQMMAPEVGAMLRQDMADAQAAGVASTPTFYVNGRPLERFGAQPLVELVASEVERAR